MMEESFASNITYAYRVANAVEVAATSSQRDVVKQTSKKVRQCSYSSQRETGERSIDTVFTSLLS